MKNQLICSAPDRDTLLRMIAGYFYLTTEDVELSRDGADLAPGEWLVYNKSRGRYLKSHIVRQKKSRWRFELINEEES